MYPQVGQLFKCECGTTLAKKVGVNHFEVFKNQNGEKTKIGFKNLPLRDGDPVQSEITCGKCGTGHILVTVQESIKLGSEIETKVS